MARALAPDKPSAAAVKRGAVSRRPDCCAGDAVVVIPACNEEQTVADVVGAVRGEFGLPCIVVNDASTDSTARLARAAGATVIDLPVRLGAWGATQAGLRLAMHMKYDRVVTCDADGQHPVDRIPYLLAEQGRSGDDLVIGACTGRGSPLRRTAWRMFRALSRLRVQDLTSGFRVYSRRSVSLLARREATLFDYQDMGILLLLRESGLSIREVDVPMNLRLNGKSRIFSSWFAVGGYMINTLILILSRIVHLQK